MHTATTIPSLKIHRALDSRFAPIMRFHACAATGRDDGAGGRDRETVRWPAPQGPSPDMRSGKPNRWYRYGIANRVTCVTSPARMHRTVMPTTR